MAVFGRRSALVGFFGQKQIASVEQGIAPMELGIEPVEQGIAPVEQGISPVEQGIAPMRLGIAPVEYGIVLMGFLFPLITCLGSHLLITEPTHCCPRHLNTSTLQCIGIQGGGG